MKLGASAAEGWTTDGDAIISDQRNGMRNANLAKQFSYWDGLQQLDDHRGVLVEAAGNMKVHDEAISDPMEVATLIDFCRKWYEEGREGRWNVDGEGKVHPLARMDSRGEELTTSAKKKTTGKYIRGLFCKKVVGRDSEKGRVTTAADFEELMKPINEVFLVEASQKMLSTSQSKITKPVVRHMPDEAWDDCDRLSILRTR
jgi:hypothetical protein